MTTCDDIFYKIHAEFNSLLFGMEHIIPQISKLKQAINWHNSRNTILYKNNSKTTLDSGERRQTWPLIIEALAAQHANQKSPIPKTSVALGVGLYKQLQCALTSATSPYLLQVDCSTQCFRGTVRIGYPWLQICTGE